MDLKRCFDADDRGVSPVIGVILMVAITVILAAVIATFVMNLGPPKDQAPTTSWSTSDSTSAITFEHEGGGAAEAEELKLVANGTDYAITDADAYSEGDSLSASDSISLIDAGAGPGSSTEIALASGNVTDIDEVKLVWDSSEADKSQVLKTWTS